MFGRRVVQFVVSAWMIAVFLVIGWGPLFVADFVRTTRPDLSARYAPQGFAMDWIRVTRDCTVLAVCYVIGHAIRLVVVIVTRSASDAARRGHSGGKR